MIMAIKSIGSPSGSIGEDVTMDRLLSRGTLFEVWRVQRANGNVEALKMARRDIPSRRAAVELLRREFKLLERLSHENILEVRGLIDIDSAPALLFEYIDGGDLVPLLGLDLRHWVAGALDVARALSFTHHCGVVHRDVKSRNVLFDRHGKAKLVDFGLAAVLGAQWPKGGGTAAYASSSQRQSATASVADDVHSFAVMLYELISGRLPFGRDPGPESLQVKPPPLTVTGTNAAQEINLARIVEDTLDPSSSNEPGGVQPFVNLLESIQLSYQ
jgi:eukaryotic-like serine/threonine-protein kinase